VIILYSMLVFVATWKINVNISLILVKPDRSSLKLETERLFNISERKKYMFIVRQCFNIGSI
jgi:hypothetical protein